MDSMTSDELRLAIAQGKSLYVYGVAMASKHTFGEDGEETSDEHGYVTPDRPFEIHEARNDVASLVRESSFGLISASADDGGEDVLKPIAKAVREYMGRVDSGERGVLYQENYEQDDEGATWARSVYLFVKLSHSPYVEIDLEMSATEVNALSF